MFKKALHLCSVAADLPPIFYTPKKTCVDNEVCWEEARPFRNTLRRQWLSLLKLMYDSSNKKTTHHTLNVQLHYHVIFR